MGLLAVVFAAHGWMLLAPPFSTPRLPADNVAPQ